MKRKPNTRRKDKSESDAEEKPDVFTKGDFERALKKVSRRVVNRKKPNP